MRRGRGSPSLRCPRTLADCDSWTAPQPALVRTAPSGAAPTQQPALYPHLQEQEQEQGRTGGCGLHAPRRCSALPTARGRCPRVGTARSSAPSPAATGQRRPRLLGRRCPPPLSVARAQWGWREVAAAAGAANRERCCCCCCPCRALCSVMTCIERPDCLIVLVTGLDRALSPISRSSSYIPAHSNHRDGERSKEERSA